MRKNDLIKLLQELPGNPELKLWNGYVSDFMNVGGLVESSLVKQTWEGYLESCRLERCVDTRDWDFQFPDEELTELRQLYRRNTDWETNPYVYTDDIEAKRYKAKRIVYINAATRGKTSCDRIGGMEY